jgi:hypothetical protein
MGNATGHEKLPWDVALDLKLEIHNSNYIDQS